MKLFPSKEKNDPEIKFVSLVDYKGMPEPIRASEKLPRWFKKLEATLDFDGFPAGTAKRCMPMLDTLTAGYLIPLPTSVHVESSKPDNVQFWWRTEPYFKPVENHFAEQIGEFNAPGGVYKWKNPWSIQTPPGYSCLFVTPFNRDLPFECFTGIVDTDSYHNMVNFPFWWKDFDDYEGILEAGDVPMIQVIPFKRENWSHTVSYATGEDRDALVREGNMVDNYNHKYKRMDHKKKKW